jgi:hypothetical protein
MSNVTASDFALLLLVTGLDLLDVVLNLVQYLLCLERCTACQNRACGDAHDAEPEHDVRAVLLE